MGTLLDVIASMLIGGMMVLIAVSASDTGMRAFFNHNADVITQQNLTQISEIIQYDLHKLGFAIPETQNDSIIRIARNDTFRFTAHLNFAPDVSIAGVGGYDTVVDTVQYIIGLAETIDFGDTTINLYNVNRRVIVPGHVNTNMSIGRIGNNDVFRYLDQIGNPAADVSTITTIEMNITALDPNVVLSPEYIGTRTQSQQDQKMRKQELRRLLRPAFWRQSRLVSRNLRR